MGLSYTDKITGNLRNFDDKADEFVISYKSRYDNLWEAFLSVFSDFSSPEEVVDEIRKDHRQYLTGFNHDRGFGRVTYNPDVPGSTPAVVKSNLAGLKNAKFIINFDNALLETTENDVKKTVYYIPGGFVLQLTKQYLAGDPRGSAFLEKHHLKTVTTNQKNGLLQLALPNGKTLQKIIEEFNAMTEVLYAEPMYCGFSDQSVSPNEAYYSSDLWGVKKIQTVNGWNKLPEMAPSGLTGNTNVKIAVIDTGVKNKHQDLGDYLLGTGSLEKKNLGEDWDFTDGGDDNPDDESADGHGTCVIGVIAAKSPNATGTVGVAPGCKVIPLRVDLGVTMGGTYADRGDAIAYVAQLAADNPQKKYILNLSWTVSTDANAIRTNIEDAVGNVVVIAAAGETSPSGVNIATNPVYPASYPNVIAVGATNNTDNKISTSNFGSNNFVFAPGTSIYTTHNGSTTAYTTTVGTSMSAAFVSGVAGLVYTANANQNGGTFTYNAANVRAILTATANCDDPTGTLPGSGRINAKKCVDATT